MFLFGCVMTIYFAMSEKNNKKNILFHKNQHSQLQGR